MNSVCISGRLGNDAELKTTKGGTSVLNFGVAVNDRRKNRQTGEWDEVTHWIDCIMFGRRADSVAKYLKKGSYVGVTGRLSQSRWEDKQGNKRSKVEVIVNDVDLPPRKSDMGESQPSQGGYGQQQNNYTNNQQYSPQNASQGFSGGYQQQPYMDVYDSDIPFGG